MKKIGAAALHKAVARDAARQGVAVARSLKWVAATAFFQLLSQAVAQGVIEQYCVKGGFSVELRHLRMARTSEDIDLAIAGAGHPVALLEAVLKGVGWGDFTFAIKSVDERPNSIRVDLQVWFNSVIWCTLKVDLLTDPIEAVEYVEAPDVARFGLPDPAAPVPCLSRPQQLAQWLHAITKPPTDGRRIDRSRNLVDVYLFTTHCPCPDGEVVTAAELVFTREPTHEWPPSLDVPEGWTAALDQMAQDLGIELTGAELVEYAHRYIVRLLGVPINVNYEYRYFGLTLRPQRIQATSSDQDMPGTNLFTDDTNYAAFDTAVKAGFRIAHVVQHPTIGGVIMIVERPITAEEKA